MILETKEDFEKAILSGEPLKNKWYWSSSENYNSYAWGQYFNGGDVDINTKNDTTNDVRPVLAL